MNEASANFKKRNPWTSAICNFFVPGMGYIYNGVGRDRSQIIFGAILFLGYLLGFIQLFGAFILGFVLFSGSEPTAPGFFPPIVLDLSYFIVPLALAYDG